MPVGNPQYGELWSLHGAAEQQVAAIVSDTSHNMYTLVSLTGMRMRFAAGRDHRWDFIREVTPTQGVLCERAGCANTGFLRYDAPTGFGCACPRHVPIGVEITILEGVPNNNPNWREAVTTIPCPSCNNPDPIEDTRNLPRGIERYTRFWTCVLCNMNWADNIAVHETDSEQLGGIQETLETIKLVRHEVQRILIPPPIWSRINIPTDRDDRLNYLIDGPLTSDLTLFGTACEVNPRIDNITFLLQRNVMRRPVQRLGGQPNRRTPSSVQEQLQAQVDPVDDLTPIVPNTYWVQKKLGEIVEVVSCESFQNTDARQTANVMVIIRKLYDPRLNPTFPVTRKDFLKLYVPYVEKTDPEPREPPQISAGEEWESANGDAIYITNVDARKEIVIGQLEGSDKQVRMSFDQFTGGSRQWRKIVRLTAYERLMLDDED